MVNPNEDDGERLADSAGNNTRRQFVVGSAGALGGLALGSAFAGSTVAQSDDEEEDEDEEEEDDAEPVENEFEDDVAILNYALTLEYLEASFYAEGLENIDEEDLCSCRAFGGEDDPLRERAYEELETIQAHEEAHVEALQDAIEELDGEPVEEPEFDFGMAVEYPMAFLGTAAQLEDVGVSAYAGAAPHIENEEILVPALGIHSVEARHASFLRTLNGETGFPAVIDEPRSRSEVEELVAPYIVDMEEEDDEENEDQEQEDEEGEDQEDDEEQEGEEQEDEEQEDEEEQEDDD